MNKNNKTTNGEVLIWFFRSLFFLGNQLAGNMASIFYEQGNMDMAILNYKRAIACDAGFLEAYNNLVGHTFHFFNLRFLMSSV